MPQSSKPDAKRRHVTTACISCRESKIKCDGATPSCSNCKTKHRECRYQAGEDKRKLSLRVAVELLSSRVDQLCHFINQNGLQLPPMPLEEAKSLTRILNTLGLWTTQPALERDKTPPIDPTLSLEPQTLASCVPSNDTLLPPDQLPLDFSLPFDPSSFNLGNDATAGLAPPVQDGLLNLTTRAIADWEWSPSENADNSITTGVGIASVRTPSHPLLSTYSGEAALSDNEDDDAGSGTTEEDLVNQLSDRLGSLQIGPNGRISYFGPTSNFSLMELPVGADTLAVDRTVRNDGQEHLDNMGYGKQVPQDLEDHLINLYFTWQDPFQHVVDRDLYEEAKHSWHEREEDTPYYSEALRNAMCSLGATFETRYHPSFITFPKSLPDFFAARAKTLLEIELDSPSVSTVQAMIVLSSHEIGANRDSRGWLYSAMAIRLAFDLALHKDMTPYVNKGVLKPAEAELRRAVFWGAYTMDQTLGFYRGRPFRISMDDITVQKPTADSSDGRVEQWLPYVSSLSNGNSSVPLQDHAEAVSLHRIELCEIMAPLGHTLYGNSRIPRDILQASNEKIVSILFAWKENLPGNLQVDLEDSEGTFLPHVILLHMQYYQNVIHAHRPWMSSSYIQPQPPQGPGYMHAQQMCIESAAAVAKLILIYERQYSLKRVHIQGVAIIFSAAIILIFASISRRRRKRTTETATHLSVCFRALEELSGTWECAKRSRDFLLMLQRKWELRSRRLSQCPSRNAMLPPSLGALRQSEQASRKRARTDSPAGSRSIGSFQSISPIQQGEQREEHEGIDMDMRLDLDWVFAAGTQPMPGNWDQFLNTDTLYSNPNRTG
ncbi:fungal-specific transcription factor domain-containing protein [Colletotrichum acutatum]|uniref:Fungal-specific transcription factor domain-containing protein n=1 Tax=Glomerella acutata TaxID=27357 RepID=A0AAD8UEQ9_GLOAC|nr:fungal-specific transcription factor domain-containing protein [Colletotrichum acutatum]KAK1716026.1 fungal-specific transcription factor domain-containing protein [Colletotrichum acutatum]